MKKSNTRKEMRKLFEKENYFKETLKIIKHFFPELFELLSNVEDKRDKRYIKYESKIILFIRILSSIFFFIKHEKNIRRI